MRQQLSARSGNDGDCFSSTASGTLYGVHPFNAKALKKQFGAEKTRRKLDRYECTPA